MSYIPTDVNSAALAVAINCGLVANPEIAPVSEILRIDKLREAKLQSRTVEATMVRVQMDKLSGAESGLIVSLLDGPRAFLPASKLPRGVLPGQVERGAKLPVKILELDTSVKPAFIIVACHDAVIEERRAFLDSLVIGSRINGTVASTKDYGHFINLGPLNGLLRRSQIPCGYKNLVEGEPITVYVTRIDRDRLRVSLSLWRRRQKIPFCVHTFPTPPWEPI